MEYISDIIIAVITGLITLIGVLASNNKKQAVIEEQIKTLTKSVEKHNNFGSRIPVIEEQIKVCNHRIEDLEKITDSMRKLP